MITICMALKSVIVQVRLFWIGNSIGCFLHASYDIINLGKRQREESVLAGVMQEAPLSFVLF